MRAVRQYQQPVCACRRQEALERFLHARVRPEPERLDTLGRQRRHRVQPGPSARLEDVLHHPLIAAEEVGRAEPAIELARIAHLLQHRLEVGRADALGGLCREHDVASLPHRAQCRHPALHGLIERAAEARAARRGHDDVEGGVDAQARVRPDERDGALDAFVQTSRRHEGEPAPRGRRALHGEVDAREPGRLPHLGAERVALHDPGTGAAARECGAVDAVHGVETAETRTHRLRAAGVPGEEVRLDDADRDAQVGLRVAAVDPHGDTGPGVTHEVVLAVRRIVAARRQLARRRAADELHELRRGGGAVGPGRDDDLDRAHPCAPQRLPQGGHHLRAHRRAREIRHRDAGAAAAAPQLGERRRANGGSERGLERLGRSGEGGRGLGREDHGVVRERDLERRRSVGERDPHAARL